MNNGKNKNGFPQKKKSLHMWMEEKVAEFLHCLFIFRVNVFGFGIASNPPSWPTWNENNLPPMN